MKKFALLLAVFVTILVGCGKTEAKPEQSTVKVGMVTDITGNYMERCVRVCR